jgi:hypothetical protein
VRPSASTTRKSTPVGTDEERAERGVVAELPSVPAPAEAGISMRAQSRTNSAAATIRCGLGKAGNRRDVALAGVGMP